LNLRVGVKDKDSKDPFPRFRPILRGNFWDGRESFTWRV